jgi:alpha-N-arabinofuranosidase
LEWGLCRSYDWRAGLHAAGSLISYEKLSPKVEMSCPALLMRNTTDDPEWRAFIYHDHVSWFPGSGYVVEKLFREHYAPIQLAANSGTFKDLDDRSVFFDDISQMKPEDWNPGTVDAIATADADGARIVIKAVNYESFSNTLLVRLQGSTAPADADVTIYTLSASPTDQPSMGEPDKIATRITTVPYASDLSFDLEPYAVMVAVIAKK